MNFEYASFIFGWSAIIESAGAPALFKTQPANGAYTHRHVLELLALSSAVRAHEAEPVAHCAYTTGRELAREWRVVWMRGVQNFLVNIGARKGGLCFQLASELLIRWNALRLQTLDLHWAESYVGTSAEHMKRWSDVINEARISRSCR